MRSRQGAGRGKKERQDLGPMPLLESRSGMLWDSRAKTGLIDSNQKGQCFSKLCRVLIKGVWNGKALGGREDLIIGLLGKSYQEFTFACDSADCSIGHVLP